MHRVGLAVFLGIATLSGIAADGGVAVPVLVEGRASAQAATPSLPTDVKAQQAIDAATAAALIGALNTRFNGQPVELQLGEVRSERVSLRDIALNGEVSIRFNGAQAWLPVRFQALYDTSAQTVESPHIVLGASLAAAKPASKLPLATLQAQVDAAMGAEFLSQDVAFRLGEARIVGDDGGRLVVQAEGVAEFDRSEQASVAVRALYDSRSGRWIDAQYDFDVIAHGEQVAAR
ncbi:hypothetical protein MASR1M8_13920 [Thermomonas brevis]